MPTLPLLADPASYRPCIQNLLTDGMEVREYWLDLFVHHLETLAELPVNGRSLRHHARWEVFSRNYLLGLEQLRRQPDCRGRLDVLELTRFREENLAEAGIDDPFLELKQRENAKALAALPEVFREIDATPLAQRREMLVLGLIAGNLFDMGCQAAMEEYEKSFSGATKTAASNQEFARLRSRISPRPWKYDDLNQLLRRLDERTYQRVLFFIDNSGPDCILGAIPLARELATSGARVVLAANHSPALNDVTAEELPIILTQCGNTDERLDHLLCEDRIVAIDSGGQEPLIDLRELSQACCAAAADCDLLILEGMGRAVESNFDARFTVDTWKIALTKDPMVARILGINLFEPVVRFDEA